MQELCFRVRHKANESLHHAREVEGGIEVSIGRKKDEKVVLSKDYFWMVYEEEEKWEMRTKKKKAAA